jgi:hypothetical protein
MFFKTTLTDRRKAWLTSRWVPSPSSCLRGWSSIPGAGKLTDDEKKRLPRARRGVGLACEQTAAALEKSEGELVVPEVEPEALRRKGKLAEDIDQVIEDMKVALEMVCQGNLLADADAFTDLRKVNKQVKAQVDFKPGLADRFAAVIAYFSRKKASKEDNQA